MIVSWIRWWSYRIVGHNRINFGWDSINPLKFDRFLRSLHRYRKSESKFRKLASIWPVIVKLLQSHEFVLVQETSNLILLKTVLTTFAIYLSLIWINFTWTELSHDWIIWMQIWQTHNSYFECTFSCVNPVNCRGNWAPWHLVRL